ncbi:MAG: aldehyde dehydrogenase family protein [Bacteroidales bacterium]|nr:aldehyde dehydrogenase family protein [Bacteroidales bacterium]
MYKLYCAGKFLGTSNILEVVNPFTQQIFEKTYFAGENEFEEAVIAGLKAEKVMKNMPVYLRYQILISIADKLKAQRDKFAAVLSAEAGKPIKYALAEVDRAIQTFVVAAEESKRLPAEYMSIDWTKEAFNKEAVVKYFPVGLIAAISPFNFPLNLAVHKIAPAIAAGCPIILKPATKTPLSTLLLAQIIDETELPKGALSVLPMDRKTGNRLVTDERFTLLTFTGSPEVGWAMKKQAGKKKVVLELGGNAGVIVSQSADVILAAKRCVTGAFAYSGQVCIHAQRIFIHESIFDLFVDNLLPQVKSLRTGDTIDISTDFSVMIDQENAIRVESWINEAVAGGAKILTGGKRSGNFVEPTVLTHTHKEMKVNADEVFGPVVTLSKFSDFEEAVAMLNDGKYGLQAGVFTNALNEMNYAFYHIDAGGVIINDIPTFRADHMPYGGIKDSGFGREGVKYAMHDMLESKILVKNVF